MTDLLRQLIASPGRLEPQALLQHPFFAQQVQPEALPPVRRALIFQEEEEVAAEPVVETPPSDKSDKDKKDRISKRRRRRGSAYDGVDVKQVFGTNIQFEIPPSPRQRRLLQRRRSDTALQYNPFIGMSPYELQMMLASQQNAAYLGQQGVINQVLLSCSPPVPCPIYAACSNPSRHGGRHAHLSFV